jgi:hypothetical protein
MSRLRPDSRRRGAVIVVVAILLPMFLIMAGFVIDLGQIYAAKSRLQATADASALAAAAMLANTTQARSEAQTYAGRNFPGHGTVVKSEDVEFGTWHQGTFTPGGGSPNAVRVTARRAQANGNPVSLFFGGFLGMQEANVNAAAVAMANTGDGACIYVLHPSAQKAFNISSGTRVITCTVKVNSTAGGTGPSGDSNAALSVESAAHLDASGFDIQIRGGWYKTGNSSWTPLPMTGPQFGDPLASLAAPVWPGGTCSGGPVKVTNHQILNPGLFCGGLEIDGTGINVTMNPGTYIMGGGSFNVKKGRVTGHGVTIYLTCRSGPCTSSTASSFSGVRIAGNATDTRVTLTGPTSGPLRGMIFFGDRASPSDADHSQAEHKIESSYMNADGVFYFPRQRLSIMTGASFDGAAKLTFIADRVLISSGSTLYFRELPSNMPSELGSGGTPALVQ